jgi:hypothetical protein
MARQGTFGPLENNQAASLFKFDDFRDFVLTPRAFIRSIIVIRLVGFYASERPVDDYASNSQSDRV